MVLLVLTFAGSARAKAVIADRTLPVLGTLSRGMTLEEIDRAFASMNLPAGCGFERLSYDGRTWYARKYYKTDASTNYRVHVDLVDHRLESFVYSIGQSYEDATGHGQEETKTVLSSSW